MPPSRYTGLAVSLLGLALAFLAVSHGGYYLDDDAYRYEAVRVTHDGDGLVTTSVATGEPALNVDVGEDIACETHFDTRSCWFERDLLAGNASVETVPSPASEYRFVYLDGAFYRPTTERRGDRTLLALERVPPAEAFRVSAVPAEYVSPAAERAVRTGSVTTFHRPREADSLFRVDGEYYTLRATGFRDFGRDNPEFGATCMHRRADAFCFWAGVRRIAATVASAAAFLGGAAAAVVGAIVFLANPP